MFGPTITPPEVLAALGIAVGWTAAVTSFVLGLAFAHEAIGQIIKKVTR